jgi:methylmalonyl-CoA mutase N-terminal domain/subunit
VNKYQVEDEQPPEILTIDEGIRKKQIRKLHETRAARNQNQVDRSLRQLRESAETHENLIPPLLVAVESYASVGEISNVLRGVWGEYEK